MRQLIVFLGVLLLSACTMTPTPLTVNERLTEAKKDLNILFSEEPIPQETLTYYQTLAYGLSYNLDYRVKQVNVALQASQLKVAELVMYPALNATGSLYTRSNDFSSYGVTSEGQPTGVLNSTPRTLRTARVGLTWNLLDFGVGYVKARQQGNRVLIAEEESRKQLQQLAQDVLLAYWNAYSAQEMLVDAKQFQKELTHAKQKLEMATHDKTIPQESLLNFQAALLEGNRRIVQLQYKYDKAMLDLKHLANLPLDKHYILKAPPKAFMKAQNLTYLDFSKVDAITMVKRPELRGQNYQERIAKLGVKLTLVQSLPGITLNDGWNYNSNKFLSNNEWMDRSVDVAWNLLNLVNLPTNYHAAKTQAQYEQLKLMAITMTVLTETRYAFAHYYNLHQEYKIAHKQTQTAEQLYRLVKHRREASLASSQQVVMAKLRAITAKMEENLLLSDMATALGELYLSAGFDILPLDDVHVPIPVLIKKIEQNFVLQNTLDFNHYVNNTYEILFPHQKAQPLM